MIPGPGQSWGRTGLESSSLPYNLEKLMSFGLSGVGNALPDRRMQMGFFKVHFANRSQSAPLLMNKNYSR
jgi:hypothetical protein